MYITLTESDMINELVNDQYANFSYNGAQAIVQFLTEVCPDSEFDRVAIRCDFSEYKNVKEAVAEMGDDASENIVATFRGGIIVQNF
jgi:hypothetical protein